MIRAEEITHRYTRKALALDGLSLEIAEGECFGLIGSNGAGKTTLLRILGTLLAPTSGRATINGHDCVHDYRAVRRTIGYMPESFSLLSDLTVEEFLDYSAAAYGLRGDDRKRSVEAVISLADLDSKRKETGDTLSRGMQQRVLLARALVHDPPVLLLDEPTSGLDPAARIEFRQIMNDLTRAGKTIVVSSHILHELSEFCTSVGIIERGKLIVAGKVSEVADSLSGPREIQVQVAGNASAVVDALRGHAGVEQVDADGTFAQIRYSGSPQELSELLAALVRAGIPVTSFGERRRSLEDIFLKSAAFDLG